MATELTKPVTRSIPILHRGRTLVARMAPEGVYIKGARERWSSAYLVPWAALYDCGAKLKVLAKKREKAIKRKIKRGLL